MLYGSRLRVRREEDFGVDSRSDHASTLARPVANRFTPDNEAMETVFRRGVSVGTAKATNLQGVGVVQNSLPPTAIQYTLKSQLFGSEKG